MHKMVMATWSHLLLLATLAVAPAFAQVDVARYVQQDRFASIKISPTGAYYAATVPLPDRTVLVVVRRSDKAFTARIGGVKHSEIADFWWISDERLVVSMAERFGSLERPLLTGELHAINADGSGVRRLSGRYAPDDGTNAISVRLDDYLVATLVDTLPDDDRNILVAIQPLSTDPLTQVVRMDTHTGRRTLVATAPVRRARFLLDASGVVRFAQGAGNDNVNKLFYRDGSTAPWRLLNDEGVTGRVEWPIGFSEDGALAYLEVERPAGPDALVTMDIGTGTRAEVMRDAAVDPFRIIYANGDAVPIGASFMKDRLYHRFFDEKSFQAVLHRSLELAFPGSAVDFLSSTTDGRLSLVLVSSDRNPGDFYLFDTVAKHADLVFSRAEWFAPDKMAGTRAIEVKAQDGLVLHGYLTLPTGARAENLPMVVLPHGGPFGVFDQWSFDRDVQLLAGAGYAVLRINFRGSGNYGRAFLHAGVRQWGGKMQNDVADATRWAIGQGIADPGRICIFGASYGAYAALMGAATMPDLYRCAVGYVGVYDLPMLHEDRADMAKWMRTWANDWLGERESLDALSPNRLANQIKAPVFLVAGGEDAIAPIKHSKSMEKALVSAGVPVETLYYPTEGHGFYAEAHRKEFYVRLLDFLNRHLGGTKAR